MGLALAAIVLLCGYGPQPVPVATIEYAQPVAEDWVPEPQEELSRVLEPTERVRTVPVEVWRASLSAAPEVRDDLLRTCYCESRWQVDAVNPESGAKGACQVMEQFHGPVPPDLAGQFKQASDIAMKYGMSPWDGSSCPEWTE